MKSKQRELWRVNVSITSSVVTEMSLCKLCVYKSQTCKPILTRGGAKVPVTLKEENERSAVAVVTGKVAAMTNN